MPDDADTPQISWSIDESASVSVLETAQVLLEAWKFRQAHCWKILRNYGLAAVVVSITPYFRSALIDQLGCKIFVFPIVGFSLALVAAWLFGAEYVRCAPYNVAFRNILASNPDLRRDLEIEWSGPAVLFKWKIGWLIVVSLGLASLVLSGVNVYILQQLLSSASSSH